MSNSTSTTLPATLESSPHSALLSTLRHCLTLARRGLLKTRRTPETLVSVTAQPILFLLLFVYLFGGALAGSTHGYLEYLVPGVLVQSVLLGCIDIGVNLNVDITKGVFDRFRSLPIARSVPLIGAVIAEAIRYLLAMVATVAFGYLLGFRIHTTAVSALAGCLLALGFALCLCWISIFVGITARTAGSVQSILLVAMFPLTFASNVFVRTDTMPGWLQAFVKANPVSQLTSAVRGLMVSGPVAEPLFWTLLWMAGLLAVFFPSSVRAYRRSS